uniref:Neural cell adhesion molecule 1-like isoform X1 n=1 Tax=Crassostrea virginica TaxID=6565 RepID=A0A8B8E1A9_CRAVI|nr:neural cell adhesion molecule 1-like isoform X1 [Crassostrea virginica]XP_022334308.1 neural cell adhesion molecule 1-like isoform X1 [Crassostrea virginica]
MNNYGFSRTFCSDSVYVSIPQRWGLRLWVLVLAISILFCQVAGFRRRIAGRTQVPLTPVIRNTTEANYTYTAGETAILYCNVENLGTKTVTWRRANPSLILTVGLFTYFGDARFQTHNVLHKDQWNLHIRNVSLQDQGRYECQVSTKGRDIRRSYQLHVREHTSTIHISGSTYVEKNQRLVLSCNASSDSYPPDDLDWFLNGIKVESNERAGVTITKRMTYRSKTIWSELVIEHAQMQNAGTYICRTSDQLITNIKVNVLNAGKDNVKRGTILFDKSQQIAADEKNKKKNTSSRLFVSCWSVTFGIIVYVLS